MRAPILPGGTIMNGDLATVKPITHFGEPYFKENVSECIARALRAKLLATLALKHWNLLAANIGRW